MEIGNEKSDSLDGILHNIWFMLEQGATHSDDPFHLPVLGTTAKEGCSLRTVILMKGAINQRGFQAFGSGMKPTLLAK